jgi:uncharacterized OB-fold protein
VNLDVPPPDDVTAGWWDATREHRLVIQTCATCGHRQHPPRALCVRCGTTGGLRFDPVSGRGVVDAWTVVHRAPRPDVPVPYTVVRIRLDEGPILLSNLADPPGAPEPELGTPVTVAWTDLPDGRALPVFITQMREA